MKEKDIGKRACIYFPQSLEFIKHFSEDIYQYMLLQSCQSLFYYNTILF